MSATATEDRITQAYIRRYPNSRRTRSWAGRLVHISTENGVWRVDGHGYTYAHHDDAWILLFEDAQKQVAHCGPEKQAAFLATRPATCRLCGCTEHNACYDDERGACSWAAPDLCSHCVDSVSLLEELITGESPTDRVQHCTGDVGEITLPMHHAEQLLKILRRERA